MNMPDFFKRRSSRPFLITLCLVFVVLTGVIDYKTGEELSISIFYLLPVIFVTWYINAKTGIVISVISSLIWHIADFMIGHRYSHVLIPFWNSIVQLVFFLTIVFILSALKTQYEKKSDLIVELNKTLDELKRSEENLKKKSQELADSNAELERFAFVAAHDLKGPMIGIEGHIQRLKRRHGDKLDADAEKIIGYVLDGVDRMKALINDLLAYARAGAQTDNLKVVNVNQVIERALSNIHGEIEEQKATVTHGPLPDIRANDIQMVQLLQNLIGNGIKFHGEEPPRVHISVRQEDNEWIFSVADNGIGIDPDNAERIFEIFKRLHSTAQYPGTGIGLAICKKIVERHGGRIWAESGPGKGTIFFFTIPRNDRSREILTGP
jgi:signal transduction histidine kinase